MLRYRPSHRVLSCSVVLSFAAAVFLLGFHHFGQSNRRPSSVATGRTQRNLDASSSPNAAAAPNAWRDSLGDGFPDGARLERPQDRENFRRWLTFLAEAQYYSPAPEARREIDDCAALIRYAYRNALVAHTESWRNSPECPRVVLAPRFGDIEAFTYPEWVLAAGLFRAAPGPFRPQDLEGDVFTQFADTQTLLHYNTFLVSRDLRAAQPGDVLFFHQPEQKEPYHSMLFVGRSYFQPAGSDWMVYHTGDLNGRRGDIREVEAAVLLEHPDLRWRPLAANPSFLGVYRFEILR